MTLLDKLRSLFTRDEVPDEAKQIFAAARTTRDLLHGLDHLVTRNELELDDVNREIAKLESNEREEIGRVRGGSVDGRLKQQTLRKIARYRKQMDNYEARTRIFNRNIDLLQHLIAKIQEIEAMKLRGVDEARIDHILMEHGEELEHYADTMSAAEIADGRSIVSAREERELAALEQEILAGADGDDGEEEAASRPSLERPLPVPEATDREERAAEAAVKAKETEVKKPLALEAGGAAPKPDEPRRQPIEAIVDAALEAEEKALEAERQSDRKRERELELE